MINKIKGAFNTMISVAGGDTIREVQSAVFNGADIVVEHVGKATWDESLRCLAKCGKIVTCGATTGPKVSIDLAHLFMKHQQIIGSTMSTRGELFEIIDLVRQKKLKPVIEKTFPLKEVVQAHKYVEEGKQFGKVVLTI